MKIEFPKININNEPKIDVSQKVSEQIKERGVKITKRWVFWAKKLGLGSGLVLTVVVLIFILNLILYWFQSRGLITYFNFGLPALTFILKKLPFAYFTVAIVLLLIINFIINKTNLIYKKYYHLLLIIIWLVIIGGGFFLFYTDINNYFEQQVALSEKKIFILSEIYQGNVPCLPQDKNGVVGKVININNDTLTLQTLNNQKTIKVVGQSNLFTSIKKGQLIVAIGIGGETFFVANKIQVVTSEMLNYCIGQY